MKKYILRSALALCVLGSLYSCSVDEYNPSDESGGESLTTFSGWTAMCNYCYTPLYGQLFSASDYLSVSEGGTDLWITANNSDNTKQLYYYDGLTYNTNGTNKLFKQAYSCINTCNAVINKADDITDGTTADKKVILAEAKTLRAFYYLILVTQYGSVPLTLDDSSVSGVDYSPVRASVADIYAQIIKDLKEASEDLNVEPYNGNNARVCKKTALGLLARAYAQGAGEDLSENGTSYWERAKEVAEDMIENADTYGCYLYDDIDDMWAQDNNRTNKEALFRASGPRAGDSESYSYGYSSNNLFTYGCCDPNKCSDLYKVSNKQNYYMGRVNNSVIAPTKYLLTLFDTDNDKRWENTFMTAFGFYSMQQVGWVAYNKWQVTWDASLCEKYGVNKKFIGQKVYPYVDCNAISRAYGGNQYVASVWAKGYHGETDENGNYDYTKLLSRTEIKNVYVIPPLTVDENGDTDEDRFPIYLSPKDLTSDEKAQRPYFCVNISDLFEQYKSGYVYRTASFDGTNSYQLYPSLIKFNFNFDGGFNGGNLQRKTGDMFIMRMAEIYLIAAEAEAMVGSKTKAADYLNVLRKRAYRGDKSEFSSSSMYLSTADVNTVLDEYARELCGEFNRFAILKRHSSLFKERLRASNPRAFENFDITKSLCRPISYDFISQINNPDDYKTDGYGE